MSDGPPDNATLQSDKAEVSNPQPESLSCKGCAAALDDTYYEVNGDLTCPSCKERLAKAFEGGSKLRRFLKALIVGSVVAAFGSVGWWAVRALTEYELGLLALVIGFGVGKAVNWGSGGRGGWPYQVLAVFLTYTSVAMSWAPTVVGAEMELEKQIQAKAAAGSHQADAPAPAAQPGEAPAAGEAPAGDRERAGGGDRARRRPGRRHRAAPAGIVRDLRDPHVVHGALHARRRRNHRAAPHRLRALGGLAPQQARDARDSRTAQGAAAGSVCAAGGRGEWLSWSPRRGPAGAAEPSCRRRCTRARAAAVGGRRLWRPGPERERAGDGTSERKEPGPGGFVDLGRGLLRSA